MSAAPEPVDDPSPERAALDRMLADRSVVIVIGPGGVGKTTLGAALAARAVEHHQRRVLVVTVDPARRLAEALGVDDVPSEPVLVPTGSGPGRLWSLMVDMSRSWDELVRRHGPGGADTEALLANPLYRSLTSRFIQSHDYIALDLMCDLADDDRYDLVVIDTPPSSHAIDVLDAPSRMIEFFDSRLLRWLIAPYRSKVAQVTARPFLAVAERVLGQGFLASIAEFFWLFAQLRPSLVRRAQEVRRRLDDPGTAYVVVTTSEPAAMVQAGLLIDELGRRRHDPTLILHNRALPLAARHRSIDEITDQLSDPSLTLAVTNLLERDRDVGRSGAGRPRGDGSAAGLPGGLGPVLPIEWRSTPLTTVADLRHLLD